MGAIRRKRVRWDEVLEEFEASDLTATAFCTAHDLSVSYFYKRRRRWRESQSSAFVPVRVSTVEMTDWTPISIEVDQLTIRCSTATPPAWIADLVQTLRR